VKRAAALLPLVAPLWGCGHPPPPSLYPPRPPGCEVQILENAPTSPTYNIGAARARCGTDIGKDECIRVLKDQVCKLGGDLVWGVADTPRVVDDKNEWSGRAAHTK
jgi:hypothetical protein